MKKILLSLFVIGVVSVAGVLATRAFFSDTETSVGNTFVAGDIDLQIDNESYAIDCTIPDGDGNPPAECKGVLAASSNTSWQLTDLTVEKFFDFVDLKPGDYGEDTISVHVGSNDAWVCASARITEDQDNSCTDPEQTDELVACVNPNGNGELDEDLNFAFWVDDGDNVFEACPEGTGECEDEKVFLLGPLEGLGTQGQIALADTQGGVLGAGNPIPGDTTFYIGKVWCFGELTPEPKDSHDVQGAPINGTPVERGTGWLCDGTLVDNAAQTDSVVGDLQFYAEQSS